MLFCRIAGVSALVAVVVGGLSGLALGVLFMFACSVVVGTPKNADLAVALAWVAILGGAIGVLLWRRGRPPPVV